MSLIDKYPYGKAPFDRDARSALAMIAPEVLFFFPQKEFISGLTSGAVKG